MFLRTSTGIFDFDLESLQEILHVLDTQLETINSEAANYPDADSFGTYDGVEPIIGLGFVACQQYLASTYGYLKVEKGQALLVGPAHRSGMSVAEIINHSANFWKHHEEGIRGTTERALQHLGFTSETDYVLSNVLADVVSPEPACFRSLVPLLEAWRDALRAKAA